MKLKSIRLINFNSFEDEEIRFSESITLIIGKNNAGKSSVIKPILQLQNLYNLTKEDVRAGVTKGQIKYFFHIENEDELKARFSYVETPSNRHSISDVLYCLNHEKYGATIEITDSSSPLFCTLLNLNSPVDVRLQPFGNKRSNNYIHAFLAKRKVNSISTSIGREHSEKIDSDLSNLNSIIDEIISKPTSIENILLQDFAREVLKFNISMSTGNVANKEAALYVEQTKSFIPIRQMGEGVTHLIGFAVDLLTSKDRLFLVEELENDLHPEALKKLLGLIVEASKRNNQFILTTHSNIILRHLGAVDSTKIVEVSMNIDAGLPTSHVRNIESYEDRIDVLRDLGYELTDMYLFDGWLILEEASAESFINQYLIPTFTPKLIGRIRTVSSKGVSKAPALFDEFYRLFLFIHLERAYQSKAWVIVDGDEEGLNVISNLKLKYPSWCNSFSNFSKEDFEWFYPSEFEEDIRSVLGIKNWKDQQKGKWKLAEKVIKWANDNPEGKEKVEASAKEVIDILNDIEIKLGLH